MRAKEEVPPPLSPRLRGEVMAYAAENAAFNLAANIYEPYIGYLVQKHSARDHHGTYGQNLAGELIGDVTGAGTLMLAEALVPNQLHAFSRAARRLIGPAYDCIGRAVLNDRQDVEKWATFQERNMVRSLIMMTAGVAGNVLVQKSLIGNPSSAAVILKGKLLSTAVTTALALGARFAFPAQTKKTDAWLSEHVFAPMLDEEPGPHASKLRQSDASGEVTR